MLRIVSDIDGVVANFIKAFLPYINAEANTLMREQDVTDYWFRGRVVTAKHFEDAHNKFIRDRKYREIQPFEDVCALYRQLSLREATFRYLTNRDTQLRQDTLFWLLSQGLIHMGVFHARDKANTIKNMYVDVFIEDSYEHANSVAAQGIHTILVDRPYNQGDLEDKCVRVHNVQEMKEAIMGRT